MELGTVLVEKRDQPSPRAGDVMRTAEARGWIRTFAPGQYVYLSPWAALVRTFQDAIREGATGRLGFQEWVFPRVIPRPALDSFRMTQFAPDLLVAADATGSSFLDPVQCVSLYELLRNRSLDARALPLKIVECLGGWTWRNESEARLDGPYRAREFLRVEHVYVGTRNDVIRIRRQVRDGVLGLLDRLGLSYQVVVGAGCMDLPTIKTRQLSAADEDDVPVQDIEVPIRRALRHDPARDALATAAHAYRADGMARTRPNDAFYLDCDELCGCSVEADDLLRAFNITASDGGELWSGCVGVGLNRLVLAFLYQHGFDPCGWPSLTDLADRGQADDGEGPDPRRTDRRG